MRNTGRQKCFGHRGLMIQRRLNGFVTDHREAARRPVLIRSVRGLPSRPENRVVIHRQKRKCPDTGWYLQLGHIADDDQNSREFLCRISIVHASTWDGE